MRSSVSHCRANPSGSGSISLTSPMSLTSPGVRCVIHLSRAAGTLRSDQFSVRGRDLGPQCWKLNARSMSRSLFQAAIDSNGSVNSAICRSAGRLEIVVPLAILLICVLLFLNFGLLSDVLLAASVIPMALVGGIFALFLTGTPFSVSAALASWRCSALPRWTASWSFPITT